MTKAEQETIFRWSADEDIVSVFTAHAPTRRKLERAGYEPCRTSTVAGEWAGSFYRVPVAELRWRVGVKKRPGRPMSEAQRTGLARASVARDSLQNDQNGPGQGPDSSPRTA